MQSYPVVDVEGRKEEKRRIVKKGTKEHEKTEREEKWGGQKKR